MKCITPQAVSKPKFFAGDSPSAREGRDGIKLTEKETKDEEAMTDDMIVGLTRSISNNVRKSFWNIEG